MLDLDDATQTVSFVSTIRPFGAVPAGNEYSCRYGLGFARLDTIVTGPLDGFSSTIQDRAMPIRIIPAIIPAFFDINLKSLKFNCYLLSLLVSRRFLQEKATLCDWVGLQQISWKKEKHSQT